MYQHLLSVFSAGVVVTACVSPAFGEEAAPADNYKWPKYQKVRFTEDYSGLAGLDAIPARDGLDALKYIPLNDEGDWYVSFGGQVRLRFEDYQNFNFGRPAVNDDSFLLQRYFLHADVHMGDQFRVFTELRSAAANDHDLSNPAHPRPMNMHDEFDVINLFGEYTFNAWDDIDVTTRVGRWEMNFGKGRVVGCRNWSQLRRSFDGVSSRFTGQDGWVEAFWAQWVTANKFDSFNATDDDISTWGVYGHLNASAGVLPFNLEPYIFGKENQTGSKDEERATVGARLYGAVPETRWSYDLEGGYQFDYGGTDVSAGFFSAEGTYKFDDPDTQSWLTFGFDWASGDDDLTDGTIKTFEPVSAFGHYYFGYIDQIGRQNIVSPWVRVGLKPLKKLETTAEVHWFWADESTDAIYSPCNCTKVMRSGASGADDFIGTEIDLVGKYKFNHHTMGLVGYSYLFAGDYVDDTGVGQDDIQRVYVQLQFTF